MNIKPHPELSREYPAIDGITHEREDYPSACGSYPGKNSIRSDVLEILNLDDNSFNEWYCIRKSTINRLLGDYNVLVSIPSLKYASESDKLGLTARSGLGINKLIKILEKGLEYLEVIKKVRDESKEP